MTSRAVYVSGALLCAVGVGLGAFGAHGLKELVTAERLQTWETAVRYELFHALGLLILGLLIDRYDGVWLRRAALILLVGVCIFSGSLYVLVLSNTPWLGALAPIGGATMIAGWLTVLFFFSSSSVVKL